MKQFRITGLGTEDRKPHVQMVYGSDERTEEEVLKSAQESAVNWVPHKVALVE